jgi:hypothetical protein
MTRTGRQFGRGDEQFVLLGLRFPSAIKIRRFLHPVVQQNFRLFNGLLGSTILKQEFWDDFTRVSPLSDFPVPPRLLGSIWGVVVAPNGTE